MVYLFIALLFSFLFSLMEGIIETLLGIEIMDKSETVADMRALARQQWIKRARALGVIIDTEE